MKLFARLRLGFILFAIVALASGEAHAKDCPTRHFYNHERIGFWVVMSHGSCTIGTSPMQNKCFVPAGQIAEFHFANLGWEEGLRVSLAAIANSMNPSAGSPGFFTPQSDIKVHQEDDVAVVSADGGRTFPAQSFFVNEDQCKIDHPDDTGILVMNEPTYGDITVDCRGLCDVALKNEIYLNESRQRARDFDLANRFNDLKNTIAAQGCVPRGVDQEHLWAQCRTLDGRLVETSLNHPLSCQGMPINPTGRAEIVPPGAGRPENANGKLICVSNTILSQCRHFYAPYNGRPDLVVMDVACRTRNYQDSDGERKWGAEITPDCELVVLDDAEDLRSYPHCVRQP